MLQKITTYSLAFILCVGCHFNGFSQRKKVQDISVQQDRIQEKIDSAKSIFIENPVAALESLESAIEMATNVGARYELAEAYSTLSSFNLTMKEYKSAVQQAKRALEIYTEFEDWEKVYQSYLLLGSSYFEQENYSKALENYENAARLAGKGLKKEALMTAELEAAGVKIAQGKLDPAEKQLLELRTRAEKEKMAFLIGEIDYKLGEIYEQRGDFFQATNFYGEAQDNAVQTKNSKLMNRSNEGIVRSYSNGFENQDDEFAYQSLNEAEDFFKDSKDTIGLVENSIQKADLLVAQGSMSEAVSALNFSYDLSSEYGDLDQQLTSSKRLYDVYTQTQNTEEAVKAFQNYTILLDSAASIQQQEQGKVTQNQIALRTIEKQINNLEKERKLNQQTIELLEREQGLNNEALEQQRMLLYVFGFILVIFLGVAIIVYRSTKAKKRAHQLLYLKSLRAQMNPHFIFNSLNSVNNYISKSNERAANKYLSKFSKLMRQVLEYSQVEFISLTKEIEVLRLYVELEHERFKDKFAFKFNVDDSINTEAYDIPPMLVQPFIENAIWHGLRYKDTSGLLEVDIKDQMDYVEISVRDNGIGREKSQELKTVNQKKHNSTGMRNVENRTEMIKAVFKAKINYEIIDLPNHEGTQVKIKVYRNE